MNRLATRHLIQSLQIRGSDLWVKRGFALTVAGMAVARLILDNEPDILPANSRVSPKGKLLVA
jgi:hypothetical protein